MRRITMSAMFRTMLFAAALAPAVAQDPVRWHGIELDLPQGWTQERNEQVLLLRPAGWRAADAALENHGLLFDGETSGLADEDLDDTIDEAAAALAPGARRDGKPSDGKLGALACRSFGYVAGDADGKTIRLTIHVVAARDGCAALFVCGREDRLTNRQNEIAALCNSVRAEGSRKLRRAFGLGKQETPAPAPGAEPDAQPAGAAAAAPKFTRIEGAAELAWNGVLIDVPKDWRVQAGDDGVQLLLPPGFGRSGVLDEIYALCGDGSLASLDAPDAAAKLQEALDEIQPGLTQKGTGAAATFGALQGKSFTFTGSSADGQDVEARVFAFPTGRGVGGMLALGFPKQLQARQKVVEAMLGSLRPQGDGKGRAGGAVAPELVGQWVFFAGTQANNGGGSSRQKVLTLRADGSYTYAAESVSTNPNGAAWGDRNDAGTWTADTASITFRSQTGGMRTFTLQKRNHAKNNDPMLVIDGESFVTATQRSPW